MLKEANVKIFPFRDAAADEMADRGEGYII